MNTFKIALGSLLLTSMQANACITIDPRFKAAETSFEESELSVSKTSNGLVFKFEGDEFYYNYARSAWCGMPYTKAKEVDVEAKKKEHCISYKDQKDFTIADSSGKIVARAIVGPDNRTLIVKSADTKANVLNQKPYLRITSSGDYSVAKCPGCGPADGYIQLSQPELKVEYVKNQNTQGELVKSGGNNLYFNDKLGDVVDRGPVFRSIGLVSQEKAFDPVTQISGNSISSGSSCGGAKVNAYQGAGAGSAVPKDSSGLIPVNR